jgi:hypothetical protein
MKTHTATLPMVFAIVAMLIGGSALAHEKQKSPGQHGGILVDSGHHHLEVVAKDDVIEVYVSGEDGKPEDVKDAKATAAILSEGKKIDVTLTAAANANHLQGKGSFKAAKGTTIVVTLTMPGHQPEQSRIKID